MLSNIVALTAGFAATASAFQCEGNYFSFFNRGGDAMSYSRLDPALFPGTESPHLHSFDGANNLHASTNFADTQDSSCTTARIKTDKSIYWRPTLFFNNGTGFTRVPEKSTKIYYKFGDGANWANVTAFPEDFNMLAGDPLRRSDSGNSGGIRWGCHQPDGNGEAKFANGFPKGFSRCDYGFASEVTFPSCWNGKKLDPANPNAHMAYPNANNGIGIENCPTTHRAARFPTIFIEFWYDVSPFNGQYGPDDTPWVVSNGDPTGFGFHADFLNGWEKGVLEKAIGETGGCNCGCGCGQEEMEQCFGKENVNDDSDAAWASCSAGSAAKSETALVFDKLPGCNPLQAGPERAKVMSGPDCTSNDKKTVSSAVPSAVASSDPYAGNATAIVPSGVAYPTASSILETVTSPSIPEAATSSSYGYPAALPSLAADLNNKNVNNAADGYNAMKPTPATFTSEYTAKLPAAQADVTDTPSSGDKNKCKAPVTVTVTPTVFVTLTPTVFPTAAPFANTTTIGSSGTTYQTPSGTGSVTLGGYGAMGTGAY